jgi:predicted transcriptional regulator
MRLLWDGPHTMDELVEETGLAVSTVRGYVLSLRKRKLVAIVNLLEGRNGNRNKHVYAWKPDARDYRTHKKTPAERQAKYRQRKAESTRHAALCFLTPTQPSQDQA